MRISFATASVKLALKKPTTVHSPNGFFIFNANTDCMSVSKRSTGRAASPNEGVIFLRISKFVWIKLDKPVAGHHITAAHRNNRGCRF